MATLITCVEKLLTREKIEMSRTRRKKEARGAAAPWWTRHKSNFKLNSQRFVFPIAKNVIYKSTGLKKTERGWFPVRFLLVLLGVTDAILNYLLLLLLIRGRINTVSI